MQHFLRSFTMEHILFIIVKVFLFDIYLFDDDYTDGSLKMQLSHIVG